MTQFSKDIQFMCMALNLARRGLGRTAPNPSVGCVIIKDGAVIGRGWTAKGGRPHAETIALKQAGQGAKAATAYVSLEPCSHQGKTSPCAKALIESGVKRTVIACIDPDPRVSGQGAALLEDAGISVELGVLEEEARALNAGFMLRMTQNRPFVTLKSATSIDGKIAAEEGKQHWITGELAQKRAHLIRSQHDAILVGSETYLVDKPQLTTRIDGYEHDIQRFVLDRRGRLQDVSDIKILKSQNVKDVLENMAEQGITRLLVEGGSRVNAAFLEAGFVDEFLWFKAPEEIGSGGLDALYGQTIANIESDFGLKKQKTIVLGEDLLEIYRRKA